MSPDPAVDCPTPVPQRPQPIEQQVDHCHVLYMKALEQLFEECKESYSILASTRLTFIEPWPHPSPPHSLPAPDPSA